MPGLITITSPATVTDLTTLAAVHDTLNIDPADTSRDTHLTRLIKQASAAVAGYCGRGFGLEGITEIFRTGPDTGLSPFAQRVAPYGTPLDAQRKPLILSRCPIVTLASVTANGVDGPGLLVDGVDYQLEPGSGLLHRLFGTSIGAWVSTPITVIYTSGFDLATAIPVDLESVALSLVASGWYATGRDPNIAMDMLDGDRTQFWDRSVSPMAIDAGLAAQLTDYVARAY